jgi:hypothetical protein
MSLVLTHVKYVWKFQNHLSLHTFDGCCNVSMVPMSPWSGPKYVLRVVPNVVYWHFPWECRGSVVSPCAWDATDTSSLTSSLGYGQITCIPDVWACHMVRWCLACCVKSMWCQKCKSVSVGGLTAIWGLSLSCECLHRAILACVAWTVCYVHVHQICMWVHRVRCLVEMSLGLCVACLAFIWKLSHWGGAWGREWCLQMIYFSYVLALNSKNLGGIWAGPQPLVVPECCVLYVLATCVVAGKSVYKDHSSNTDHGVCRAV